MDREEILGKIQEITADRLGVDESDVTSDASFREDLEADSLDLVELIMELEEQFGMEIPDEEAEKITTVEEAVDYVRSTRPRDRGGRERQRERADHRRRGRDAPRDRGRELLGCGPARQERYRGDHALRPSPFPSQIAGECSDFDPTDFMSKKQARRMDRFAQLGIAAGIEAAESAGIADLVRERPERVAIVMGSGIGGLSTWEREYRVLNERGPGRVSPFLITMMVPNMAAGQLAIMLGATGPSQCPVLACATGARRSPKGWS